ncbi:MAG: bifunctional GNAT family N-acetyltransferase/class I SAM-dependent methyltransferase [Treponema sp.]|nr:bifunctional GNAT family N-acetyltransferase/class I SAM-dependent methyltransferase [Treponema sp.]
MENVILVKPDMEYAAEIMAYKNEFLVSGDRLNGCAGLEEFDDPEKWIERCRMLENLQTLPPDRVLAEEFMLVTDDKKVLGMINFRHFLNDYLAEYAGHIGYSVRPSRRRSGYAGKMLAMCLDRCRQAGLDKVLLTCMSTNEGSRRTILGAGGVYERTTHKADDNTDMERYWIYLDPLEKHYNTHNEDSRFQSKSGSVEFLTSMRYIRRYLNPGCRVLEIGAGTGRYSLALADLGYSVDAVELIGHNIEVFKKHISPEKKITIRQGNALDLNFIPDNSCDITLLLGPMYHLYTSADKRRALSEALRVTKTGGVIFAAYCIQDASIVQYGFCKWNMEELFAKKLLDPVSFKAISYPAEIFDVCRREDIDDLMKGFNTDRLHYVATDLFTQYIQSTVNAMDDAAFRQYLDYHFSVCERSDMAGITNHSLDIFRKL